MELFDIYYRNGKGHSIDRMVALPKKPNRGTRFAVCQEKYLIPSNGEWKETNRENAHKETRSPVKMTPVRKHYHF